jgi:hypothetical protein
MRRLLFTAVIGAAPLLMAGPAAAHTQTVTPPGQDGPVVSGPIARPWIQGHCQAAAPFVTGEASGGVVIFSPQGEVACDPAITNPGGQSTGP